MPNIILKIFELLPNVKISNTKNIKYKIKYLPNIILKIFELLPNVKTSNEN